MTFTFDARLGRYRDARGAFVAESTIRDAIDQVAQHASDRMADASRRLLDGVTPLDAWRGEMQRATKAAHLASAVIANGGTESTGPREYGRAGRAIRDQYQYLRDFAEQIESGQQPLNGSLVGRAKQYGQQARAVFERERGIGQAQRGYQSERNVLHPAEHCALCVAESAKGWVPIGTLVKIGQRTCRGNDKCTLAYRKEPATAEQGAA